MKCERATDLTAQSDSCSVRDGAHKNHVAARFRKSRLQQGSVCHAATHHTHGSVHTQSHKHAALEVVASEESTAYLYAYDDSE